MMRLSSLPRFTVAPRYVLLAVTAGLSLAFAAGCLYSPSGVNKSTELYPAPDENNVITVTFKAPADKLPTEKVTFQVVAPTEEASVPEKVIEDTGPEFTATYAADNLDPGLYFVDVFYDEDLDNLIAKLAFVVPEEEASPSEDATGEDTATEAS